MQQAEQNTQFRLNHVKDLGEVVVKAFGKLPDISDIMKGEDADELELRTLKTKK